MKCVLDTNILLVTISSRSQYHWIFDALLNGAFDLCITHEMLLEYEEVIARKFNPYVADDIVRTLLMLPNVERVNVFFQWNLIPHDPDDNKFVDCAVSAGVDYLVTDDHDYDVLQHTTFPQVRVITLKQFMRLLRKSKEVL